MYEKVGYENAKKKIKKNKLTFNCFMFWK